MAINDAMISSQGDSTDAQEYEYLSEYYGEEFMLVDISILGKQVQHGPFKLNETYGTYSRSTKIEWDPIIRESNEKREQREQERRRELEQRLLDLHGKNNNQGVFSRSMEYIVATLLAAVVPNAHAAELLSFEVEESGLYEVAHADLLQSGLDLRGFDVSRLGLKEGNELVPMHINSPSAVFSENSSLLFPGRGLDTLYSSINKYTLVVDEGSKPILDDSKALAGNDVALAYSYLAESVYAPQNHYSYLSPEDDDSWYADQLNAISEPVTKTISLDVEGYAPPLSFGSGFGNNILRQPTQNPYIDISLWGASALPGNGVLNPDHHVQVMVNEDILVDVEFDGLNENTTLVPLATVESGENSVSIKIPNDRGYLYDLIKLDHVILRYPRQFEAKNGSLVFSANWEKFRVSNIGHNGATVIRLDEAGDAYFMTERGSGDCANSCVYFAGLKSDNDNTYFVSSQSGKLKPTIVSSINTQSMSASEAKYIIISHPDFIATNSLALEGYGSDILGQYGSVDIVDVEAIYGAYAGGVQDAYAIKAYIKDAYLNRGTRHILLVGGDIYDYRNYLGTGAKSFIPSIYQPISNDVKAVPSDSSYVLIDDDLVPDLTISRLPVRTTADLDNLILKRQKYISRATGDTVLFAADELDSSNYSFKSDAERLIFDHFQNDQVTSVFLDEHSAATAKSATINAFDSGVSLAAYFGHASTDRWSLSSMLSGDDIASLSNQNTPTVVTQWGCWNTFYVSPASDSMAHRFLLEGQQGAVTVMGATSFTQAVAEKRMAGYLFSAMKEGKTIGDAVLQAKEMIAEETPHQLDVLLGWTVLGFDDMVIYE